MQDTKKRKVSPDKQITFLKDEMTMQFLPVSKNTGKPVSLPEGPRIYTDQRELMDMLIRYSIQDAVVIMSRYISKWKVQSKVCAHANLKVDPDSSIFDSVLG